MQELFQYFSFQTCNWGNWRWWDGEMPVSQRLLRFMLSVSQERLDGPLRVWPFFTLFTLSGLVIKVTWTMARKWQLSCANGIVFICIQLFMWRNALLYWAFFVFFFAQSCECCRTGIMAFTVYMRVCRTWDGIKWERRRESLLPSSFSSFSSSSSFFLNVFNNNWYYYAPSSSGGKV